MLSQWVYVAIGIYLLKKFYLVYTYKLVVKRYSLKKYSRQKLNLFVQ